MCILKTGKSILKDKINSAKLKLPHSTDPTHTVPFFS